MLCEEKRASKKRLEMISASTQVLIGAEVVDINDTVIGKVEDLLLDLGSGSIVYAVLSLESDHLGNGCPGRVVLPWNALILDRVENTFTLDVDIDLLQESGVFAYYTYPRCAPC
jgi:sporulation protein YlmC with PRC-barrel domain